MQSASDAQGMPFDEVSGLFHIARRTTRQTLKRLGHFDTVRDHAIDQFPDTRSNIGRAIKGLAGDGVPMADVHLPRLAFSTVDILREVLHHFGPRQH